MDTLDTIDGTYPYFPLSDRVIYVTRGYPAEENNNGISHLEWLAVIGRVTKLIPDEHCEIKNPHTEKIEKWVERGRARCISADGRFGWFSYMPRHISATVAKKLPSVRMLERFEKVVAGIGRSPSLGKWRTYVNENPYLRLAEQVSIEGKSGILPGRAITKAKSGGVIVFRPSAVFIYFSSSPYETDTPDPVFLEVANKIAALLKADVDIKGFL